MIKKIVIIPLFLICISALGQKIIEPKANRPMPDFKLNNITNYETIKASRDDFKGKWLILDFWTTTCMTCIQSFPKVNSYYKEFKDRLTWMMVGVNDTKYNSGIKDMYEKFRKKQKLEMPSAYDSVLVNNWNIHSYPHIIIIDPSGVTRFITSGRDLSAAKIRDMLDGIAVSFDPKEHDFIEFEPDHIEYIKDKYLYRSLLTKWNGEIQHGGYDIDEYVDKKIYLLKGYSCSMIPLFALYNYAYYGRMRWDDPQYTSLYGKVYTMPILEIKDSSLFQYDFNFDVGKGTYNYSLCLPAEDISKARIMQLMQEDLKRYFKYDAVIEKRKMPVWKLIAVNPGAVEMLKTKGGDQYFSPGSYAAGYTWRNVPAPYLISSISFYLEEKFPNRPFVDDTGLTENFDFSIEADMTDIEDVRRQLRMQGLDLVKGEKEMKVLVISDPKK